MYKFNVYSLNWEYLGCFWAGNKDPKYPKEGDYISTRYQGCILTKKGEEFDKIHPIQCYIKYMGKEYTKSNSEKYITEK